MTVNAFARDTRRGLAYLAAVALAVTFVIAFQQQHRTALKLADPRGGHISDFDRWMVMTPHFLHEHADYLSDELPTPPLSLIVFAPLTMLSRPDAAFVWVCVKLPLACFVLWLCAQIAARSGCRLTAGGACADRGRLVAGRGRGHAGRADQFSRAGAAGRRSVRGAERAVVIGRRRRRAHRAWRCDESDPPHLHRLLRLEAAMAAGLSGGTQHSCLADRRAGTGLRVGSELAMAGRVDADHDCALRHARHCRVRDEPVGGELRAAAVHADAGVRRASRRGDRSATT